MHTDPLPEKDPALQRTQLEEPMEFAGSRPGGHATHFMPSGLWSPGRHGTHSLCSGFACSPGAHGEHTTPVMVLE